jgi:hypothetical protein
MVREVLDKLKWDVLAGEGYLDAQVTGGYVADLLSCVMAGAEAGNLWITLQTHANIVAVASLLSVAAIVVAEGAAVPENTLSKAEDQGIAVLSSKEPVYETVAQLISLGI